MVIRPSEGFGYPPRRAVTFMRQESCGCAHTVWLLASVMLPVVGFFRCLQLSHRLETVPRAGFSVCYCKPGFLGPSHPIPHFTLAICLRWGGLTSFLMSRSTSSLFFRAPRGKASFWFITALYLDARREVLYTHRYGCFWDGGLR